LRAQPQLRQKIQQHHRRRLRYESRANLSQRHRARKQTRVHKTRPFGRSGDQKRRECVVSR
jgi:hypothetical protein